METHLRSVVKGISWRVIATMVTTVVVFIYSGELAAAAIVEHPHTDNLDTFDRRSDSRREWAPKGHPMRE